MYKTIRTIIKYSHTIIIQYRARSNNIHQAIEPLESLNGKLLKVAIIGMPNAGKSTFINSLMDRKVCAASSKVHTTRSKATAVFTQDDTQIVFVDTPGMVNDKEQKKFNLEKTFIRDCKNVAKGADIIGVIHDVKDLYTREKLDIKIIKLLEYNKLTPSFLVLNKVDLLKSKRKLLDLTRQLTHNYLNGKPIPGGKALKKIDEGTKGWPNFQDIFMISALTGDGIEEVRDYLLRNAKPGPWLFPDEVWTDQSPEDIILKTVHAKLFDFMPQEIPYQLKPFMEYFNVEDGGAITAFVTIECRNERIMKLVSGAGNGKLRQITAGVEKDLQEAFHNNVKLKIVANCPTDPS